MNKSGLLLIVVLMFSFVLVSIPFSVAQPGTIEITFVSPTATTYTFPSSSTSFIVPVEIWFSITGGDTIVSATWDLKEGETYVYSPTSYTGPFDLILPATSATYTLEAAAYGYFGSYGYNGVVFSVAFLPAPTPTATPPAGLSSYNYNFLGPYFDDGSNATGYAVQLTVTSSLGNTSSYSLSDPINSTISTDSPLVQATWNASSVWNITRMINFMDTDINCSYRLYVVNPLVAVAYYNLNIVDFASMSNPYLQVSVTNEVNGVATLFVMERHNLESASTVPFCLSQFQTYTLTVICDQGSYSQLFTAGNEYSVNIPILAGMFPASVSSLPTFDAARLNSSSIGLSFVIGSELPDSMTFTIFHVVGSVTYVDISYSASPGYSNTYLWVYADSDKTYTVNATATVDGKEYVWVIPVGLPSSDNPFLGLLDWLGKNQNTLPQVYTGWPYDMSSAQIAQFIGASIVALFLCIGSFRSAGACCLLSWIIFGVLLFLGWFGVVSPYTIPQFALSGVVGLFIVIDEGKQQVREA